MDKDSAAMEMTEKISDIEIKFLFMDHAI